MYRIISLLPKDRIAQLKAIASKQLLIVQVNYCIYYYQIK